MPRKGFMIESQKWVAEKTVVFSAISFYGKMHDNTVTPERC